MIICCILDYNRKIKQHLLIDYNKIQNIKDNLELGDTICILEDEDFIEYTKSTVSKFNDKIKYLYDIIFLRDRTLSTLCDEYTKYLLDKFKYETVVFIPLIDNMDIRNTISGNVSINDNTLTILANNKCSIDLKNAIQHEIKSVKILSESNLDFTIDGVNVNKNDNIIFKKQPNPIINIHAIENTNFYGFTLLVDRKEMHL